MSMFTAEYLDEQREAELLVTILMGIEPSEPTPLHQSIADRILCDLIEMGLANMDAGPATFQRWVALGDSNHPDFEPDADEDRDRQILLDTYRAAVTS